MIEHARTEPDPGRPAALALEGLARRFGGVRAVDGLDLVVEPGRVVGLIGPNGSGKSTTLDLIGGQTRPDAGRIRLAGRDVTDLPAAARARLGLARTFQHARVFERSSLIGNLRAAGADRATARRLLAEAGLADRAGDLAGTLSHAERRRLELARAAAARPAVLLMDEPASGLAPGEVDDLRARILALAAAGTAVLLVEHLMALIMEICDRIAVLDFGIRIAEGTPAEIRDDPAVRRAYLGEAA
ncbi:MAG: ATP-binding cassette domain-containing protein [Azospirillaceae bacterium]